MHILPSIHPSNCTVAQPLHCIEFNAYIVQYTCIHKYGSMYMERAVAAMESLFSYVIQCIINNSAVTALSHFLSMFLHSIHLNIYQINIIFYPKAAHSMQIQSNNLHTSKYSRIDTQLETNSRQTIYYCFEMQCRNLSF